MLLIVKIAKYIGFCVYRRSYLIWSPVILISVWVVCLCFRDRSHLARVLQRCADPGRSVIVHVQTAILQHSRVKALARDSEDCKGFDLEPFILGVCRYIYMSAFLSRGGHFFSFGNFPKSDGGCGPSEKARESYSSPSYYGGPSCIGPAVHTKTYISPCFY